MNYVAKRQDGTFETLMNGLPYHVVEDDPLFAGLCTQYPDLAHGTALVDGVVEQDNRGCAGWVYGEAFTMNDFGPLPEGFSDTPPPPTLEEMAAHIRSHRDSLIVATDYLVMPDYPLSDEARAAVAAYRQALRDITKQAGFPHSVEWPDLPSLLR